MREIVLDTETTGLHANQGDRVFEIGAVVLENHLPSGEVFHVFLDPERDLSAESTMITGVKNEDLEGKPKFREVLDDFLRFLSNDKLVIHNATFDIGFLNMEFDRCGVPPIAPERVVDTLAMAKRRFPGASASLDALCRRFGVDNSGREKHGALLDAELLAEVYLELIGGRQPTFALGASGGDVGDRQTPEVLGPERPIRLSHRVTKEEASAHAAFIAELGDDALWRRFDAS